MTFSALQSHANPMGTQLSRNNPVIQHTVDSQSTAPPHTHTHTSQHTHTHWFAGTYYRHTVTYCRSMCEILGCFRFVSLCIVTMSQLLCCLLRFFQFCIYCQCFGLLVLLCSVSSQLQPRLSFVRCVFNMLSLSNFK